MAEYGTVTELPGINAHKEQLERLVQRYYFASEFCKDKEVLEVACGGGIGLGYLARTAKKVVGGDIDENILKYPRDYYKKRKNIEIKTLDAQKLQFSNNSFDVIIMYEAIYYLPNPEKFIEEARRVLRKNGSLIICTVNKDWEGFNPSVKAPYVKGSKEILDNYFRICQCFVATGTPQEEIDEIIIQRGMVPFFR